MKGYHSTLFFLLFCGMLLFTGTLWGVVLSAMIAWAISFPINRFLLHKRLSVPTNGAVLITGCSSGLGLETAIHLAHIGFTVFSSVRKMEDFRRLRNCAADKHGTSVAQRLVPVLLDVTKKEDISTCVEYVSRHCHDNALRFLGLVNNAGYGETAPLEILPIENLRENYEVNLFGQVAVTQAFLPLIRKHNNYNHTGRVIFIGSGIGLISVPMVSSYCSTKMALEAVIDAWRVELKPWNIEVVDVISGRMGSEFGKKAQRSGEELVLSNDEAFKRVGHDVLSIYKQDIQRMKLGETITPYSDRISVAKGVEDALLHSKPYPRYFCGVDVNVLLPFALQWPEGLVDLTFEAAYRWFRSPGKTIDISPSGVMPSRSLRPVS